MSRIASPRSSRLWPGSPLLLLAAGIALLTPGAVAGRQATQPRLHSPALPGAQSCRPAWRILSGPNAGSSYFAAMAASSPHDIWAVGASGVGTSGQPFAARWDGAQWRVVSPPALPKSGSTIYHAYGGGAAFTAVAAPAANDVWAAGTTSDAAGTRPFMAHWTAGRWRLMPLPDTGPKSALLALAALSPSNIWAVGDRRGTRTLAEHWDGRVWRLVSTPRVSGEDVQLAGVAALSPRDIWAVGSRGSGSNGTRRALIEHWDGRAWRIMPGPQPGVVDDALSGVAASSANDIWAVGTAEGNDYEGRPLVERWDGARWRVMPSPSLPPAETGLATVAVSSPRDVWAATGGVLAHWTGTRWITTMLHTSATFKQGMDVTAVTTPDALALVSIRGAGLWAVGKVILQTDQQYLPLSARYASC